MKKNLSFLSLLLILPVFLSGCIFDLTPEGPGSDDDVTAGGVWKTIDFGKSWRQQSLVANVSGQPQTFGAMDCLSLAIDPSDHNALYFGSRADGIFYSFDGARSWQLSKDFGQQAAATITVDPEDKCTIYAASYFKLYKSEDCARNWNEIFVEDDPDTGIYSIVIDHYNPANVYISNSRGDVIKSLDFGETWQTIATLDDDVTQLAMSPHDSRVIFAATEGAGLYKTADGGATWENYREAFGELDAGRIIRSIAMSASDPGFLLVATRGNILKTVNWGDDWTKLPLITTDNPSDINAMAISAQNPDKIFYVTDYIFFRSSDGGQNWGVVDLPTPRRGSCLAIDYTDDSTLYMGTRKF